MQKRKIKGIVPVLLTPLTKKKEIDELGTKKLLKFLSKKDIGGLWVLGTGGEDMNLSFKKRLLFLKLVKKYNKEIPLIVGASFYCMEESIDFIKEIDKLKFEGIHIMPYHPLLSLKRLEWVYQRLAEASRTPIWAYSSANWCQNITPEFIENISKIKNLVGVKYSTSNLSDMEKVARLSSKNFTVLSAVAKNLLASLSVGVDGSTSSLGSPLPEVLISIFKSFERNDIKDALKKQRLLNKFLESWGKEFPSKDNFLKSAEEKGILEIRGICKNYTTDYYKDCTPKDLIFLKKLLRKFYPGILK